MAESCKVIDIDIADMVNKAQQIQGIGVAIKKNVLDIASILTDMGRIWDANTYKVTMTEYNKETENIMKAINYFKCSIPNAMIQIANAYNKINYGDDTRFSYKVSYSEEKNNIQVNHHNLSKEYDTAYKRNIDMDAILVKLAEIDVPYNILKKDIPEIIKIVEGINWNKSIEAENFKRLVKNQVVKCYDYITDYYNSLGNEIVLTMQRYKELESQNF